MKKLIFVLGIMVSVFSVFAQNTVITDDASYTTGESSAMLDIKSTTKGLLIPRVSSTGDVSSPATGLLVYQTGGTAGFYYYNGTSWVQLGTTASADNLGDHTATSNIQLNSHYLSNDGGNEGIRIDNSGFVYIGGSNINHRFYVAESTTNRAIGGRIQTATGDNYALFGQSDGSGADRNNGVYGIATGAGTENFGVYGNSTGTGSYNFGVVGKSTGSGGANTSNYGVNGLASGNSYENIGAFGEATSAGSNFNAGIAGRMSVAGANNVGSSGSAFGLTSGTVNIGAQGWAWDYNGGTGGTATDIAFYGINGHIVLDNVTNSAAELRFVEPNSNSTNGFYNSSNNYTAFKAQAQSSNVTYTLPASDGNSSEVLSTDGSGSLSWSNKATLPITSKSATYTATTADYTIIGNPSGSNITINLPAASGLSGRVYVIKNISATDQVVIDPNSTETIDGATTYTTTAQYESVTIQCDGSNWYIISKN